MYAYRTQTHIHAHTHTHTFTHNPHALSHIKTHLCVHVNVHVCVSVCIHRDTYARVYVCVGCGCIHMGVYTCVDTHIRPYRHTYEHIYVQQRTFRIHSSSLNFGLGFEFWGVGLNG